MTVRETLYGILSSDSTLAGLGYPEENVYANGAPDSPPETGDTWLTIQWGEELPALGGQRGRSRTTVRTMTIWFYDRQRDFGRINSALKRTMDVMDAIEQSGPVLCANWQGDGLDGWDDVYQASFKNSTYTIIANGD